MSGPSLPLPIDPHIPALVETLASSRSLVLTAPPGAGKSTRLPPALVAAGPVFLLQPRRVAARSLARRIADEQGWTIGDEVGWQVRFERRFGPRTRVLVATEGILSARFEADPLLSDFATVVLDEFHERSIHADLALAFARQAQRARGDLRLVVMSATLGSEAERIAAFLGDAPIVEVDGRPHPIEVIHRASTDVADAVRDELARPGGDILCFLAGAPEIRAAAEALARGKPHGADVRPLHGSLDAVEQDRALQPSSQRRVILATNIAETSLTVEGVDVVVDTGLHKVARYDPTTAIDRLDKERISEDSAAQRAGRAGRTGPGRAIRLWDARLRLRAHREPDIARIDLAGPVLEVMAWGGEAGSFEWFERPHEDRLRGAVVLLEQLGAVSGGRLTDVGRVLRGLPLHPRLGRVLLSAGGGRRAAAACAVLSEPAYRLDGGAGTDSDVLHRVDRMESAPFGVRQAAGQIQEIARRLPGAGGVEADDVSLRRALLAGFSDRLARRRDVGSPRLLLASGHGAILSRDSGVTGGTYLVALDVVAGLGGGEAQVRSASVVERDWLTPIEATLVHRFDAESGCVRAVRQETFRGLVLREEPVAPEPEEAERLLAQALAERGLDEAAEQLLRRLRFAGLAAERMSLVRDACRGQTCLRDIDIAASLSPVVRYDLDRLAPLRLAVPSGRTAPLEYREDGSVAASVKLQELFGLAETPRVGPRQLPVTLLLLAPNGRPVQTTTDLRGFWDRTYAEVRKELRGRYPKHPWPEDPWTAQPTHRAKRR